MKFHDSLFQSVARFLYINSPRKMVNSILGYIGYISLYMALYTKSIWSLYISLYTWRLTKIIAEMKSDSEQTMKLE